MLWFIVSTSHGLRRAQPYLSWFSSCVLSVLTGLTGANTLVGGIMAYECEVLVEGRLGGLVSLVARAQYDAAKLPWSGGKE